MDECGTPTSTPTRYQLRPRTPTTPNTPSTPKQRILRSKSTPITGDKVKKEVSTPLKSINPSPQDVFGNSPVADLVFNKSIKTEPHGRLSAIEGSPMFKTPMAFKPRLVGNKPVPSLSRQEIWKQQLGLTDDPSFQDAGCDKENTTDDDDDDQNCHTSKVEYRALQRVLNERNAQRDESLLQIKNCKDKIRHYKSRLEREETNKRQQLKILKKTHETQLQEKEKLIDNLTAIVDEQEEKIRELEESAKTTPRKRGKVQRNNSEVSFKTSKLIEEIKRLQAEKLSFSTQLNDVQFELTALREDNSQEIENLKQRTGQTENSRAVEEPNTSHVIKHHNQQVLDTSSTDTEKQVDFLQAENNRLQQELTDIKNAHTKAMTVTKLNGHRQQQLEDELKRYKDQTAILENKLKATTESCNVDKYREEITSLEGQNIELQGQVRELQMEISCMKAKSPEVVQVTKVKEVESEKLKKQYQACKEEIKQLKEKMEKEREELLAAQTQAKYLERTVRETEKSDLEAKLLTEMDSLHQEHLANMKALKEKHRLEKQQEVKAAENRLRCEHSKELQELTESLNEKHSKEIEGFMDSLDSLKELHKSEMAKIGEEEAKKLAELQQQKQTELVKIQEEKQTLLEKFNIDIEKVKLEKESLTKEHKQEIDRLRLETENLTEKHKTVIRQMHKEKEQMNENFEQNRVKLKEDFEIAKKAALLKLKEELNKEANQVLETERERLEKEHEEAITVLKESHESEKEDLVKQVKEQTRQRMKELEDRFTDIQEKLLLLSPVLSEFVESYVQLQKEVQEFPKIIQKTVCKVKKEMTEAIKGISEYNTELVNKYHKEMRLRKKYHNELVELKGNIRVFCRVRPIIKEDGSGQPAENIVTLDNDDDGVLHVLSKGRTQTFDLDKVFDANSTQEQIFEEVKALVTSCIDGYNVCIFAYGQTGSGKTYTMEGKKANPGINQRALSLLFEEVESRQVDWEYTITVSVIEIYNEMIRDLLGDDTGYKMEVKMNPDGGYHIPGLCYISVSTVDDVNECFSVGQQNRATASTNMNEHSSRSHCLLCVTVLGVNKTTGVKSTGKLNLVDLAGSERVSKSKADGARLKEAQSINKSLSCLGDVIYALRSKQNYIPYRNSRLTYLLQDSLGGDSKTLMITQISPVRKNEGETICSLNFAQRVRNVELGAATRKLENGDGSETETASPARGMVGTPRGHVAYRTGDHASPARSGSTPQQTKLAVKQSTPSSGTKLTPITRQSRKNNNINVPTMKLQ